jgi:hypothetical protein
MQQHDQPEPDLHTRLVNLARSRGLPKEEAEIAARDYVHFVGVLGREALRQAREESAQSRVS